MQTSELIARLEAAKMLDPYGEGHPAHSICPHGVHDPMREPWIDGYDAAMRQILDSRIAALRARNEGEG